MSENRLFLSGEENKYSSAVAIASIVKYIEQFFSILLVTSASNLQVRTTRFCSVIFGVTSNLMIRYDSVYLTCNKKLTGSQLSCIRVMNDCQFGFRNNRSTSMAVLEMTDKINEAMENKAALFYSPVDFTDASDLHHADCC